MNHQYKKFKRTQKAISLYKNYEEGPNKTQSLNYWTNIQNKLLKLHPVFNRLIDNNFQLTMPI